MLAMAKKHYRGSESCRCAESHTTGQPPARQRRRSHSILLTPVNRTLLIYTLYSFQKTVFPPISSLKTVPHEFKQGYSWIPRSHAPTVLFQTYTPKTLAPFDDKDGGRIFLTINGIVFEGAGFMDLAHSVHGLEFV